jgi:hypothetical protein
MSPDRYSNCRHVDAPQGLGGSATLSVTDECHDAAVMIDCAPFGSRKASKKVNKAN